MSKLTDQIVAEHTARHPTLWERRTQDPLLHAQLEWTRRFLGVLETVLQREGVHADQGERILGQAAEAAIGGWDGGILERRHAEDVLRSSGIERWAASAVAFGPSAGPVRPDEETT